jgi:hypothetical protein
MYWLLPVRSKFMRRKAFRRGATLLWAMVSMTALMALASLAVDYGRAQVAKNELRRAADAASRAGASYLGNISAVQAAAVEYAGDNQCLGQAVTLDTNADVEFGDWDPSNRTFTVLTGTNRLSADSVRVTCRRIAARNTSVPLLFGWVVGKPNIDVTAVSIAAVQPQGYGLVGLNYIKLSGNASASYWSGTGTVAGNSGNIASNGDITSSGSSTINGTVFTQPGKKVTGISAKAIKTLPAPLSYPNGDPGAYSKTVNDNSQIPPGYVNNTPDFNAKAGQSVPIPSGNYVFNNFTMSGGSTATFSGPVTIFFYGNFNMSGNTVTKDNVPGNLKIVAIPKPDGKPPGSLTLSGSAAIYANIYAPQSDITLSGSGAIYGSVVGKSITMSGSSDIYYDLGLVPPGSSAIALVK